jgi:hypothetical protein
MCEAGASGRPGAKAVIVLCNQSDAQLAISLTADAALTAAVARAALTHIVRCASDIVCCQKVLFASA